MKVFFFLKSLDVSIPIKSLRSKEEQALRVTKATTKYIFNESRC